MSRWTETITLRDSKAIIEAVAKIADIRGTDMTALWREAIRYYLKSERLTEDEKAAIAPILATKATLTTLVEDGKQRRHEN